MVIIVILISLILLIMITSLFSLSLLCSTLPHNLILLLIFASIVTYLFVCLCNSDNTDKHWKHWKRNEAHAMYKVCLAEANLYTLFLG